LSKKNALVRVDFNVPFDKTASPGADGYLSALAITDDGRIRASLPTIRRLLDDGYSVALLAHLGRPKGEASKALSLTPIAQRLTELLGEKVALVPLTRLQQADASLFDGFGGARIGLVENVRFDPRETSKVETQRRALAAELARDAQVFVLDGFGVVHRDQASVTELADLLPAKAGLLVSSEIAAFDRVLNDPAHPYVVVLGGAKVSDKIQVIRNLLEKADTLLIGGAMAFTFLAAEGVAVGKSLVEAEQVPTARELLALAKERGVSVFLPSDVVVAESIQAPEGAQVAVTAEIPEQTTGLDIGPATVEVFADQIRNAATVVWNGPMGVFEVPAFAKGTVGVAQAVADCRGFTVIGGGDTAAAIRAAGLEDSRFSHVSTGGGASLELLEGKTLPGLVGLQGSLS
jgi:phosphoglycerate kinase